MKILTFFILMFISSPLWADDNRYLDTDKVFYEKPIEADVLKVNTSLGYCTVLEFPDKPMLVTVGDNSLIQVEIPQNSKSVVIKPLQVTGETNLFVFTPNQRFNYKVLIGDAQHVDYVLDSKASVQAKTGTKQKLSIDTVLKMARSYNFYKKNRLINEREFIQKNIFYQCPYQDLSIDVIEAFSNKDPHFLILHIVVHNLTDQILNLNEPSTDILVGNKKFIPQYVLFDSDQLAPSGKTDGWLVLENSYVSINNKFSLSLGAEDTQYVCKQSVS